MKILQVHNSYQQPGGEDQVCSAEFELLTSRGHAVVQYLAHNDAIGDGMSAVGAGVRTIWNPDTRRKATELIQKEKPDVVHVHNTFPLISPAIYYAAASAGVPVVQTLHNYRLICPAATLFRDGHICEECVGTLTPYPAVVHRCYRNSASATAAAAAMLVAHRIAGTWREKVETYVALTNFSKQKFVAAGFPAQRIAIKPNCLASDPGPGSGNGGYALFAGRLTEEKGVHTLLDAWKNLGPEIPLKIAGDGPMYAFVKREAASLPNVQSLGYCDRYAVLELMREAALVVVPSRYFEHLPMTIVEALACGTPVIAAGLGSLNELIQDGETGLHFTPGDADDLAQQVRKAISQPACLRGMRRNARLCYERNYTAARNYELLMSIYARAVETHAAN